MQCSYQTPPIPLEQSPPKSGGRAEGAGAWTHGLHGTHSLQSNPWGVSANALTHHAYAPCEASWPRRWTATETVG